VLFHELVHAHHASTGTKIDNSQKVVATDANVGLGHQDIGLNREEHATVGLGAFDDGNAATLTENNYRAQQHSIQTGKDATELTANQARYLKRPTYRK
jgi:hypothetical protein